MDFKKIVILEDNEDMRRLIEVSLQEDPRLHMAGMVANALDAVSIVRRESPDLLLVDHYIEGPISGFASIPALRTLEPRMKLVMFTSQDFGLEASLQREVDAFLQKRDVLRLSALLAEVLGLPPLPGKVPVSG